MPTKGYQPSDPPNINIVLIHCHDLGQYLGCYGAPLSTAHLDNLAAQGVRFTRYACTAAQCSPSRGSIMTGRYPHQNGLMGLAHIGWELNDDEVTLPMYLNEAGYSTWLFGEQHETSGDHPERLGYRNLWVESSKAREVSQKATGFLKRMSHDNSQQPFFASIGFSEPHRPYNAPGYAADDPAAVQPPPYLPDRPGIREDLAGLHGLIGTVDEAAGRIVQAVDDVGLADNTLVIFTTDHGIAMPRAKGTCYDPGIMTALIMRLPGLCEGGKEYHQLLSNVDLLPTLLELTRQDIPERVAGRSFLPLPTGGDYQPRDHIFAEMTWHDKYNPMRAIRTEKYKYIRNFGDRPLVYLPLDIYEGRAGEETREEYYATRRPQEELYDIENDPLEQNNLAGKPEYGQQLRAFRDQVEQWREATNDPLLDGPIPPTEKQAERLGANDTDN